MPVTRSPLGDPRDGRDTDLTGRRVRRREPAATSRFTELHHALIARVLHGEGKAPTAVRRAAFDAVGLDEPMRTLVDKVSYCAHLITDADVAALRTAGRSEDEVFEIVVCAAIGQATRQYQSALAALATATKADGR